MSSGQLEKAQKVIPEVLNELPNSPTVNFAVANVYGKLERYEEAEKHFRKAIVLFEDKVQARHFTNLGKGFNILVDCPCRQNCKIHFGLWTCRWF